MPSKNTKKMSSVEVERRKKKLFEAWSELIDQPNSLRKTSEMNFKWQIGENNEKIAVCPNSNCNQKFTTRQGLTYHFQRCGVNIIFGCKICDIKFEAQKSEILHHLYNAHKDQLPVVKNELTDILVDARKNPQKPQMRKKLIIFTLEFAADFHEKHYANVVLMDLLPRIDFWIPLSTNEYSMYIPDTQVSPKFKISTVPNKDWSQLNIFESVSSDDHFTCFVGGSVWAASWCPLPIRRKNEDQFIAVATCKNNDAIHPLNHLETECSVIQLWNCGKLGPVFNSETLPQMCLGIGHNYGVIWDLEWCPGGTSWQPPDIDVVSNEIPRLGLLALACGDGIVRIISVPHPQCLQSGTKFYRCEPVVILDPPGVGPSVGNQSAICRCVSWQKTNEQRLIAAGFGNGVVAVWDLTTTSSLLVIHRTSSQTILRPLYSWIAHGALVNDLKWLPYSNQKMIVTGSFDRSLKVWDLKDLSVPTMLISRKSIFTKVDWVSKWFGVFASFDDSYANWQASNYVIFKDYGFLNWPANPLTPHRGCVWNFALSEFVNAAIGVDSGGEAVMFTNFVIRHDSKQGRRKPFDRLPFYRMGVEELKCEPDSTKPRKLSHKSGSISVNWIIDRQKPLQRSYNDMVNNYGIVFHDVTLKNLPKIPEKEIKRIRVADNMQYQRLSDYPLVSFTKVEWNPNVSSFNWVLTAGQSGFVRLSCLAIDEPMDVP